MSLLNSKRSVMCTSDTLESGRWTGPYRLAVSTYALPSEAGPTMHAGGILGEML